MQLPENIKAYFSFTKKERIGVLTLIAIILIVFMLPWFFPTAKLKHNETDFEQFKSEIAQLKIQQKDSGRNAFNRSQKEGENDFDFYTPSKKGDPVKITMFYFDPNTATENNWKNLGLRDKTIHTIQNYLSKGGKFKKPEDLQKIYGLSEEDYQRLLPYIQIESKENVFAKNEFENKSIPNPTTNKSRMVGPIDINEADTAAFISLPGIGSKLANRIIGFRQKLGGFYSVDQVGETYNLPDSTFQKIKPFLKLGDMGLIKININTSDAPTLKTHPYISWILANAIVQYRNQHGLYKSVDELKNIAIVSEELYNKIAHYLEN